MIDGAQTELAAGRARQAEDAADQAKSHFLAMMSHEMRTPLHAVIGFADAIAQAAQDNTTPLDRARMAEFSRAIHDAGQNLLGFVNNMLDVARIESGHVNLAEELIDVARLAREALRQIAPAARKAEIGLELALADETRLLRGDERQLRQVLGHLLGNAVKFTRAGGNVVVASAYGAQGDLTITVRDTGIGIPPEELERVFKPFGQIDTGLARRATGAGTGLYFCRAIVGAHGGTIRMASEPGCGTTVRIVLPATRLHPIAPPGQAARQPV